MTQQTQDPKLPVDNIPDEQQTLIVSSHLLIRDVTANKTLLNKRLS